MNDHIDVSEEITMSVMGVLNSEAFFEDFLWGSRLIMFLSKSKIPSEVAADIIRASDRARSFATAAMKIVKENKRS